MKTYYNDTPRKVAFENKSIGLKDAIDYFSVLSDHKKSYIGFVDIYDDVILFKWLEKDKWLIDHPIVPDTLHRQRYAAKEECLAFVTKIFEEYDISTFKDFEDVPIQEFTLDEILEFKEEDTYLLKEEEPPVKKVDAPKNQVSKVKKTKKTSFILGDISVPKPETRTKSVPKVPAKKKQKTSPLQQFKTSSEKLKKANQQPSIAKTHEKLTTKKTNTPKSIQDKTEETNLLQLGKTSKPKKTAKSTIQMGEQLGTDQKSTTTPTPPKSKIIQTNPKKDKSNNDDGSLLSI
ncbi:hypothetical protein [Aquimarina rubra]|uniref:DUF2750 domain-containing protein n=1 Tax=Aquimarina rubra TaxID=1920033 RepID=A0ABW5LDM7_9FLAO